MAVSKHQRDQYGVLKHFNFTIPLRNFLKGYLNAPGGRKYHTAHFEEVVGDRDLVFDIQISAVDHLTIEITLRSQRLASIYLLKCRATPSNMGTHGKHWKSVEFNRKKMSFGSPEKMLSSVNLTKNWTIPNNLLTGLPQQDNTEYQEPSICFLGRIFCQEPTKIMLKNMKDLLKDENTSDVEIFVGEKKFFAHKCVLSARSPFFKAMFSSNMKESVENVVRLRDEDPRIFEQVLSYIYTDNCPKITKMAVDLLIPADKYNISGLRLLCEEEMLKSMDEENVCDYLVQSGVTNSKRIYNKCVDFIVLNRRTVMKTIGWTRFKNLEHSGRFMSDILEQMNE